jgi:hypothetical protein
MSRQREIDGPLAFRQPAGTLTVAAIEHAVILKNLINGTASAIPTLQMR